MSLYNKLKYVTKESGGEYNWLGNLRWYVCEEFVGKFSFRCISNLPEMTHEECVSINMTKKLFEVHTEGDENEEWTYGVDYIKTDKLAIYLPFHEYGAYIQAHSDMSIHYEGVAYQKNDVCLIRNGYYYIALKTDIPYSFGEQKILFHGSGWLSVSYYIDESKTIEIVNKLAVNRANVLADNMAFWESYLESCPVVGLENDYTYVHETLNIEECFSSEEFVIRQLWHYQCLLMNVSEVEFNKFPIYMAPDKINWIGTWSNDGPQCMAALSLTNQREITRKLIVSYLTNSLTKDGEFSWYMHADGTGCYGVQGDVGRFSHGAPYLPQMIEYYLRNTGDNSILSEDVGGMSVYEKVKTYVLNLHSLRDINKDLLIEWANLWETGWDDKGGTFFTSASLEEWMEAVSKGTEEEITSFYDNHQRPVIAIVEQVITLWSLGAMSKLSTMCHDENMANYCKEILADMKESISRRCWNEEDGFYYDIDVKSGSQTTEKSADAFYWLNFEDNMNRAKKLLEHLNNEDEFNCYYVPMLSKDSKGFNQFGYWSGGHWPREMSIIAMGLHRCGFDDKATELLVRAIMSERGNVIAEVIEPLEGKRSTKITKMACAILNSMALLDITDKVKWYCGE